MFVKLQQQQQQQQQQSEWHPLSSSSMDSNGMIPSASNNDVAASQPLQNKYIASIAAGNNHNMSQVRRCVLQSKRRTPRIERYL